VFLPMFASLADIFGRHWALQISLFFFIVGSAISTGAENMIMMIMGRGIAGVGAAGLTSVIRPRQKSWNISLTRLVSR
jgi:MFS family permease